MQRSFLLLLLFYWQAPLTPAQNCGGGSASAQLDANNILARINAGGALFNNRNFIPNPQPGGTGPSTMYGASLWIGGRAPGGQLKLMVRDYAPTGFFSGPLDDEGFTTLQNCLDWDRVFKIEGADIPAFLSQLPAWNDNPDLAIQQFPAIMGWPARGNPFFAQIQGYDLPQGRQMAPFYDKDGDALYNPLKGDYPAVQLTGSSPFVPAQLIWSVYNGFGAPADSTHTRYWLKAEIHQTAWAFDCENEPVLNNTVFTAHRVFFRGQETLDSCFVGMWADFDIGCSGDDYTGCRPDLNTFFAYNIDTLDGTIGNICTDNSLSFDLYPPAQSATLLGWSMDKFMYYNHPGSSNPPIYSSDPGIPFEFYHYLSGSWKDGTPLTTGDNGYNKNGIPTSHAFPGNPSDPLAWTMCSAQMPARDIRSLASHYLGNVAPGREEEFVVAWTTHTNLDLPCGLGATFDEIAAIRDHYHKNFTGVCSPLTSAPIPYPDDAAVELYPNPAGHEITLRYGNLALREIRLLTPDGRLIRRVSGPRPQETLLPVGDLPSGIYLVQLFAGKYVLSRTVVIRQE